MKVDVSKQDSAVIRAFPDEAKKKMVIQIEDRDGQVLAYINLSLEKASDLSDCLAVYVAQLRKTGSASEKRAARSARPVLLC
jgi:hypothetical protein